MINNKDLIRPFLKFNSADDFYHLQILKRKKENPELGSNSYVVKTYYISSLDYFDSKINEIIDICKVTNGRAMINLNKRSFEKIAFQTLRKVSDQIFNRDYKSIRKSYETVCGAYPNESDKKWIIDVDTTDFGVVKELVDFIKVVEPTDGADDRIKAIIPSKNGFHIITSPFRLDVFKTKFPDIDVHKDNPTNLYIV